MRRTVLILISLGALVGPSADAVPVRRVDGGHGLGVVLPHGWRLSHTRLTTCSSPADRFVAVLGRARLHTSMTVPTGVAIILVQEAFAGKFPARPAHFTLGRLGRIGGCCEMPDGRGTEVLFRDHGRNFYAFVYATTASQRHDAVELLNSLRVSRGDAAGA
jgi:hypothetical protein